MFSIQNNSLSSELSLIQQSLHSYRQHGSVGSIEEGEDVVVVRPLPAGQHLVIQGVLLELL